MKDVDIHLLEWDDLFNRLWSGIYINDPQRKFPRSRYFYGHLSFWGLMLNLDPRLIVDFHKRICISLSLEVDLIIIGFGLWFEWEWSRVSDNNPLKDKDIGERIS